MKYYQHISFLGLFVPFIMVVIPIISCKTTSIEHQQNLNSKTITPTNIVVITAPEPTVITPTITTIKDAQKSNVMISTPTSTDIVVKTTLEPTVITPTITTIKDAQKSNVMISTPTPTDIVVKTTLEPTVITPTITPVPTPTPTITPTPTPSRIKSIITVSPADSIIVFKDTPAVISGITVTSTGDDDELTGFMDWGDGTGKRNITIIKESGRVIAAHVYEWGGKYRPIAVIRNQYGDEGTQEYRVTVQGIENPNPPTPTPTHLNKIKPKLEPIEESEKKISQNSIDLKIKNIPHNIPKYERKEWKHWSDDDKDCQNTRHEVLIDESIIKVNFKDNQNCQVSTGEWLDPYTGYRVTDATKLDVDHMVPLKNAHDSGAWAWDKNRKSNYANYMQYQNHLIAVTASANRQKGAQGPEKWMPSNKNYWCEYSKNWIEIKVKWSLSATKSEWNALQRMQETCDVALNVTPIEEKQTIKTPVPDTPIENNQSSGSQNIQISSLNCKGKPEILEIFNQSDSHQNMTMWSIIDDGSKHTFNFPAGYLLGPQMSVQIVSGAMGENTQSIIYWKKQNVWNNNGDTATILDSKGNVVVKMDCP